MKADNLSTYSFAMTFNFEHGSSKFCLESKRLNRRVQERFLGSEMRREG